MAEAHRSATATAVSSVWRPNHRESNAITTAVAVMLQTPITTYPQCSSATATAVASDTHAYQSVTTPITTAVAVMRHTSITTYPQCSATATAVASGPTTTAIAAILARSATATAVAHLTTPSPGLLSGILFKLIIDLATERRFVIRHHGLQRIHHIPARRSRGIFYSGSPSAPRGSGQLSSIADADDRRAANRQPTAGRDLRDTDLEPGV